MIYDVNYVLPTGTPEPPPVEPSAVICLHEASKVLFVMVCLPCRLVIVHVSCECPCPAPFN